MDLSSLVAVALSSLYATMNFRSEILASFAAFKRKCKEVENVRAGYPPRKNKRPDGKCLLPYSISHIRLNSYGVEYVACYTGSRHSVRTNTFSVCRPSNAYQVHPSKAVSLYLG
jgi:hypothetical protein